MSYNVAPNVALTVRRGVRSHTRDHVERPPDPARRIPGCGSRKNNDGTGAVPSGRGVSTLVLAGDRGNEVRAYPRTVGIIETRVFVVIELTRMPSRHDARAAGGPARPGGAAGTQVPRDAGPVLVDVLAPETTPRTGASHTSEVRTYTATEPTSSQLRQCLQSNLETLRKLREQRR